jgi:hypothetical protein
MGHAMKAHDIASPVQIITHPGVFLPLILYLLTLFGLCLKKKLAIGRPDDITTTTTHPRGH